MWVRSAILALTLHVGLMASLASEHANAGVPGSTKRAPAQSDAGEDLRAARALLESGEVQAAAAALEAGLDRFDSSEARRLLGVAYFRLSRWGDALAELDRAITIDPGNVEALLDVADVYLTANLPDEAGRALGEVDRAIGQRPGRGGSRTQAAHVALSELYAASGRAGDARRAMERASTLDGPVDRATIFRRIGDFATTLVDYDAARASYIESLARDPRPGTRVALGDLHRRTNAPEKALDQYNQAREVLPGNVDAHTGAAGAYLMLGRIPDAVRAAREAVSLDAGNRRARYVLGRALVRSGDREAGRRELEEYRRLETAYQKQDHRDREIHAVQSAAMVHLFAGDTGRAVALLEQASRDLPEVPDLRFSLGLVLSQAGRHEDSIAVFRDLLEWELVEYSTVHRHLEREYALVGDTGASASHGAEAAREERSERVAP